MKAKLEVVHNSVSRLELISTSETPVPIAVKANRIDFDEGKFAGLTLFIDNRNVF